MLNKNIINNKFIPRNIEQRIKDLKVIKAKELQDYNIFLEEFSYNLSLIKDKVSDYPNLINPQEQLFIKLIKDTKIELDQKKYPFKICLLQNDKWMFHYDWKNDVFRYNNDSVFSSFNTKFSIQHNDFKRFISFMLEKHFKFKPFKILNIYWNLPINNLFNK
ncbi:MAG: hypothetical protein EKK64_11150 [Neisseriaceae bacterium]|nr:MAG: hypothetical protein EKK64_11150 [Neisseriaceae bacterium]